ncbi:MAG TPA: SRPBCC family protein [Chloroflexia bacterium]|nr:SRPBCC family protein [Chloroflexia bacterium]
MAAVSSSVTINQPVEKVFEYVTNVDNHKAWQAGIMDAAIEPKGPAALGSIYKYGTNVMGKRYDSQMQISAFEPNKQWSIKTLGIPTPVETVYRFEGQGSTTRVTISMELAGGYPAAAEAAVKGAMQKSLDEQGARIKQFVEK